MNEISNYLSFSSPYFPLEALVPRKPDYLDSLHLTFFPGPSKTPCPQGVGASNNGFQHQYQDLKVYSSETPLGQQPSIMQIQLVGACMQPW